MKQAKTTNILIEDEDYFVADLDNGGVRIGHKDFIYFDYPANHVQYESMRGLTLSNIENVIDENMRKYNFKGA